MTSWYSDEALRKQAEADRLKAAGEQVPLTLLSGILEPRVPPAEHERCHNCGADARAEVGGREYFRAHRWCQLCIDRGRPLDWYDRHREEVD